jgi:hypothetical protein
MGRAGFAAKVKNFVSGPSRSVSVIPRQMGGYNTQVKIEKYFTKESVKRNQNPTAYLFKTNPKEYDNLVNPLADLKKKLNIRGDEEPSPRVDKEDMQESKGFGFYN